MKVTLDLPDALVHQFRCQVPDGERSKFVADLLAKKLKSKVSALERAAKKANTLHSVNHEMKDWEALNTYED
jgi:hypothetical protein